MLPRRPRGAAFNSGPKPRKMLGCVARNNTYFVVDFFCSPPPTGGVVLKKTYFKEKTFERCTKTNRALYDF